MTGALTVEAMEANGSPVNAAAVRVYGRTEDTSTFIMCCYTDENGLSEPIFLPAPNSIHSMQSNPQVCPYAAYDVYVTKDDYDKEVINGVQKSYRMITYAIPRGIGYLFTFCLFIIV